MPTFLYCTEPGSCEYLMNEIKSTSKFINTSWPKPPEGVKAIDYSMTAEAQRLVAEDIRDGWKNNGNKPDGTTYRIEQKPISRDGSIF